jgi:hypothetical protein
VVLVPERWPSGDSCVAIRVEEFSGSRARLRPLFELVEDSARQLDSSIERLDAPAPARRAIPPAAS